MDFHLIYNIPMTTPQAQFNARHNLLRAALADPAHPQTAIDLFLSQHAYVHFGAISHSPTLTLADTALSGMGNAEWRAIPEGCEHSAAWIVWHAARIEDAAMNIVLAGREQVFTEGGWQEKLTIELSDTGNLLPHDKVVQLGLKINLPTMLEYRNEVGKRTRENVLALDPAEWRRGVDPARVARLIPEGAVAPYATGVPEYWGGMTNAGLLLMPPTRHNLIHLNEIMKMKKKFMKIQP
jgi:hypothetical protein